MEKFYVRTFDLSGPTVVSSGWLSQDESDIVTDQSQAGVWLGRRAVQKVVDRFDEDHRAELMDCCREHAWRGTT